MVIADIQVEADSLVLVVTQPLVIPVILVIARLVIQATLVDLAFLVIAVLDYRVTVDTLVIQPLDIQATVVGLDLVDFLVIQQVVIPVIRLTAATQVIAVILDHQDTVDTQEAA